MTEEESTGKRKSGMARAASLTPEQRKEIAKKGAEARWKNAGSINSNKNRMLLPNPSTNAGSASIQGILDLQIEKQIEIDGIGMGVLTGVSSSGMLLA